MKVHQARYQMIVDRPLDEVFAFFEKPENLAVLTPRELGFVVLTPSPIEMKQGALIDYTIRIMGKRVRWRTMITTYSPPHRFIDEQLLGPYSFWHHTHEFEDVNGSTRITDTVRYLVPFGFIGVIAQKLFVRRQLDRIFEFRAKAITNHFSSSPEADTDSDDSAVSPWRRVIRLWSRSPRESRLAKNDFSS